MASTLRSEKEERRPMIFPEHQRNQWVSRNWHGLSTSSLNSAWRVGSKSHVRTFACCRCQLLSRWCWQRTFPTKIKRWYGDNETKTNNTSNNPSPNRANICSRFSRVDIRSCRNRSRRKRSRSYSAGWHVKRARWLCTSRLLSERYIEFITILIKFQLKMRH